MKKTSAILSLLLITSTAVNIWQFTRSQESKRRPHHYDIDRPYIDKAIALWSKHAGESKTEIKNGRYAKAIYFENEVCISLSLESGSVGGAPVYCFREDDKKLSRKYDNVE